MKKKFRVISNTCFLIMFFALLLFSYRTYRNFQHVLTYRPLVRQVLAEEESSLDENLILAMIYTESKGRAADILQASESLTGNQASITTPRESLQQGIAFLDKNMARASEKGTDSWSAVQAYNYGSAYIDYVADRGHISTVTLAETYSREVVAPSLGNTQQATYPFYNPIGLFYGGTSLYQNGGNPYYAKQVAVNLSLIRLLTARESE